MIAGDILKLVGRKTNIMDSKDRIIDTVVTREALLDFLNIRIKEVFTQLAERYPELFTITATRDLVADKSTYIISGKAEDSLYLAYVGVKYSSADDNYTRAKPISYHQAFKENTDDSVFYKSSPRYILKAVHWERSETDPRPSTGHKLAIRLLPTPDEDVTNGLMIRYVEYPPVVEEFTNRIHGLPDTLINIIATFIIADVWEAKGDWGRSERAMNRARIALSNFLNTYSPISADEPRQWQPVRRQRANSIRSR